MDEMNLNTVDAVQENVVDSQNNVEVDESVQTNNAEVVEPQQTNEPQHKQSADENTKYASIRREAEAKARDKTIAEIGMEWNGEPITTYDQYVKAKAESDQYAKEQQIRAEYEAKGVPEELLEELIESKRDREERRAKEVEVAEKEKQQKDLQEFITAFPDVKTDDIPTEVWEVNINGKVPLRYAYADHALQLARKADAIAKANADNAKSSTGSVSTDGTTGETYFTAEQVKGMSPAEVKKNFTSIERSMKNWK